MCAQEGVLTHVPHVTPHLGGHCSSIPLPRLARGQGAHLGGHGPALLTGSGSRRWGRRRLTGSTDTLGSGGGQHPPRASGSLSHNQHGQLHSPALPRWGRLRLRTRPCGWRHVMMGRGPAQGGDHCPTLLHISPAKHSLTHGHTCDSRYFYPHGTQTTDLAGGTKVELLKHESLC